MIARVLSLALLVFSSATTFAAGREIAPRTLGPSPFQTSSATHVAYAGGRFLTVWRESLGSGARLMGALNDESGRRISPSSVVIALTNSWDIDVAGTGDSFAVFWTDNHYVTRMVNVDLEGRVSAVRIIPLPQNIQRRIAWNGAHFLAALELPSALTRETEAVLFTREGAIVRRGIPLDDLAYAFDIAVVDSGFFVFSTGWLGLYVHHIAADGTVTQKLIEPAAGSTLTDYRPQRAASTPLGDGRVLLAWSSSDPTITHVKTAIVSASGESTASRIVVESEHALTPLELMQAGEGFVLAYAEHAASDAPRLVHARMLHADGSPANVPESDPVLVGGFVPMAAASGRAIVVAALTPEGLNAVTVAIDASAHVAAPEIVALSLSAQSQPALGAGGGRLVAAWTEYSGYAGTLRAAAIDPHGRPLAHTNVAQNVALVATRLAWSGTEYLAAGRRDGQLIGQRLTVDGLPIDEPFVIATTYASAAVAWAFDRWVVLWHSNGEIFFASVSPNGMVLGIRSLPLAQPPPDRILVIHSVATAFDGQTGIVVWTQEMRRVCWFPICDSGERVTLAARIDRDGMFVDATPLRIDVDESYALSAAASGMKFAIVSDSGETVVTFLDEQLHASRRSFDGGGRSDVMWDGSAVVVATRNARRLLVRRIEEDGSVTARAAPLLPSIGSEPPSIAAAIAGNAVIAVQELDPYDGARAVVISESEMEPFTDQPRRRSVRK